jgi:hypothetical protein
MVIAGLRARVKVQVHWKVRVAQNKKRIIFQKITQNF